MVGRMTTNLPSFDRPALEAIFSKMDEFLIAANKTHRMLLIGSTVLIMDGMPSRGTMDIDSWKLAQEDVALLQGMAQAAGILFCDEGDAAPPDVPHLQRVGSDFLNMPDYKVWEDHVEAFWQGQALTLSSPPLGVTLGSKMALFRDKDVADINWIVDRYPSWKESLDRWFSDFSSEDQIEIERNMLFVNYHISVRDTRDSPSANAAKILPRKNP